MPDGSLGAASDVQKISGPLGPQPAVEPPGSFAIRVMMRRTFTRLQRILPAISSSLPTWDRSDLRL